MKEEYKQPKIMVVMLNPHTAILSDSPYGSGIDVTGIDDTPGGQEDFG